MRVMWLKTGTAAVLTSLTAAVGLVAVDPAAQASGNCYHYEIAGWAQVFSQPGYNGDCFEWKLGTYTAFPSYMYHQDASLRSWPLWYGQRGTLFEYTYNSKFEFTAGVDYEQLGGNVGYRMEAAQ
ncbi:hypothetical protein AB0L06_18090 [Spirillospora sp. NPDC052269]